MPRRILFLRIPDRRVAPAASYWGPLCNSTIAHRAIAEPLAIRARRFLGQHSIGKVLELDREGKTIREWKTQMPHMVTALPGGGILAASPNTRKVVELDRTGRVVREFTGTISPYKADRR